jgi:GDPmannose 4,6-dehydratase
MTRALITGFTGMVGSHLADHLLDCTDWDLFGMCRWRSPLDNIRHLIPRINAKDRVFMVDADLTDYSSLAQVVDQVRPDYVFHLAAQSYPKTSFSSPLTTLDVNVTGTARLLDAILKNPHVDPVIHVCASSEVFGRVPADKLPINEECSFHPASPYAISKVGTDLIGRYYGEAYGMKAVTTRMFTHTGPRRGDVLPPVLMVGNLDSMRTWADVRDAVRAYYLLVTVNPIPGEYYNIGGTFSCTVGKMLEHLLSLSVRSDIKVEVDPERLRPVDADLQVPDTAKFTAHTGWKPEIPFEKTMADLLDYWRQQVRSGALYPQR